MRTPILAAALVLTTATVFAQSPYAVMQSRAIKALSEQQIADLKEGRGMGLALAAELNGYPGPSHLLELADKLDLSAEQRARVQQLFDSMKQEALPLGASIVDQEAELDRQFSARTVTTDTLKAATASIAVTQGRLRESHLKYHLATATILTPAQMQRYTELRGYGGHGGGRMHRHN